MSGTGVLLMPGRGAGTPGRPSGIAFLCRPTPARRRAGGTARGESPRSNRTSGSSSSGPAEEEDDLARVVIDSPVSGFLKVTRELGNTVRTRDLVCLPVKETRLRELSLDVEGDGKSH
jgi:hypothetical protein